MRVSVHVTWLQLDLQFAYWVVVSQQSQLSVQGVQTHRRLQAGEGLTCKRDTEIAGGTRFRKWTIVQKPEKKVNH